VINKFDNNNELVESIKMLLNTNTGVMAKTLARKLVVDKHELNAFLHHREDLYYQDKVSFEWFLVETKKLIISFPKEKWLNADLFEESLKKVGSPLECDSMHVVFNIAENCSIMVDAASRLLSLCNQLVFIGKKVSLDFSVCKQTLHYLDRIGFFDLLNNTILILPSRPTHSKAMIYKGQNENVKEFGEINPQQPDASVPEELQKAFVFHAGDQYESLALTVIAEPFNNVHDHSESPISGFAALQRYNGTKKHIQTVISDSGIGIVGTLRRVLEEKYPKLAKKYNPQTTLNDALLIKEVVEKGEISQVNIKGRGCGLKRTHDLAVKYTANLTIRQEFFEVKLFYKDGELKSFIHNENMPKILGTHICFDFFLD
jgi:hypothetical protein